MAFQTDQKARFSHTQVGLAQGRGEGIHVAHVNCIVQIFFFFLCMCVCVCVLFSYNLYATSYSLYLSFFFFHLVQNI